jgi:putative membrane protein
MKNIPKALFFVYLAVLVWSGFSPNDRAVWYVEAATSLVPVAILAILYWKGIRLSNSAYVLMAVFPIMHAIGAHYTFAEVPFGWFDRLFGFQRDMYDRVAHFAVGFYAFGIIDMIRIKKASTSIFLMATYALFSIMALAAAYEIFEWLYAVSSDPSSGLAVLGSQGDIWDTQKDMLMDTSGAVVAVVGYLLFKWRSLRSSQTA